MLFKRLPLKTQKKFKKLWFMYQNAICICISWNSKIYWFLVKNADVIRIQEVCHMPWYSNIFRIFFKVRYNCAKFYHCRIYVTGLRKWSLFAPPPPPPHLLAVPKKPTLNRVNQEKEGLLIQIRLFEESKK